MSLTVYCPFSVAMNHFRTRSTRSCGVAPAEIAAKRSGCSHQYAGNSVRETGERMTTDGKHRGQLLIRIARSLRIGLHGGAVILDRSPVI